MEYIIASVALVTGAAFGWTIGSYRSRLRAQAEQGDLAARLAVQTSEATTLRSQLADRENAGEALRQQVDAERQERARLETRFEESARRLADQQRMLDETERKLKDSFASLSAEALKSNAEQFLATARKSLEIILAEARGDLGKRQEAIKSLIQPISETLKRYEDHVLALEQARQKAYGSLEEQLKSLTATSQHLQTETGRLAGALRNPGQRGRWGELTLRRVAELAGMHEHCDFELQASVESDGGGRLRPDMIVRLPGGRTVVVDAKTPLDAYLQAMEATDESARCEHFQQHARRIRDHVRALSAKHYWAQFEQAPEVVVLFLPAESFFSAATDVDRDLITFALENRVILASPTTFVALLRAIAFGWRQEQLAENAEQISRLGRELYDRIRILVDRLDKVGSHLGRTVSAFNDAVGSLESRVLPSARRFRELGAGSGDEIGELRRLSEAPRELAANGGISQPRSNNTQNT